MEITYDFGLKGLKREEGGVLGLDGIHIVAIIVWFDGTIIDIGIILLIMDYSVWLCWVMIGGCAW